NPPGMVFDGSTSVNFYTGSQTYIESTGLPVTTGASTVVSGTTYKGEWVQIQFYTALEPRSFTLPRFHSTKSIVFAGSNNGSNWSLLASDTHSSWASGDRVIPVTGAIGRFSYFRAIITAATVGYNAPGL